MTLTRVGIVPGTDGLPIISKAVIRDDTVYLCGVTPEPLGDVGCRRGRSWNVSTVCCNRRAPTNRVC